MTKLEMDRDRIVNSVTILIIAYISLALMYLIGVLFAKIFKMQGARAVMHAGMSCFGNIAFVAYPLIRKIYGDEGILYAALFNFANDTYLWTIGVYRLSSVGNGSGTAKLKKMINPGTIAVAISFAMMGMGLHFGGILKEAMEGVGGTTTYMSMMFLGGTLAAIDFRRIYKRVTLFSIIIIKMLLFPAGLAILLSLLNIDKTVAGVAVFQVAMPVSTVLTILAAEYQCDVKYGAEGAFLTTAACIATLPVAYWVILHTIGLPVG